MNAFLFYHLSPVTAVCQEFNSYLFDFLGQETGSEPYLMPLGSPKPSKDFCNFRGSYVLWAHMLPCSFFHTSCLCSTPMVSETQATAFCGPFPSSSMPLRKTPKHPHKSFMSTGDFIEVWVENRWAFHSKNQHPCAEHWVSLALGWPLLVTPQEDFIWPSIPFVTFLKPVFWPLPPTSLLNYLFPLPSYLCRKQILLLAWCGAV